MWSTHRVIRYKVKVEEGMASQRSWSELKVLPIETSQFWFDALAHDDIGLVESTLRTAEGRERAALLNGYFQFNDGHFARYKSGKWFHLQLPFSVAVTCASFRVISSLLKNGADPCKQDSNGNNCIHSLVIGAFYMPESEALLEKAYKKLLTLLTQDQVITLLSAENEDGLRPLEFASQQGTVLLMKTILQTKGMYITKEEIKGLVSYQWMDITEYESYGPGNRREKSPLLGLMYLDVSKLGDPTTTYLFTSPLMQRWFAAKMKCSTLPISIWFLIRLIHIVVFFVFQADVSLLLEGVNTEGFLFSKGGNATQAQPASSSIEMCDNYARFVLSNTQRLTLMIYLMVHSGCIVLFDLCHILRRLLCCPPLFSTNLKGKKQWAVHYVFYRICQFFTGLLIGSGIGLAIVRGNAGADVSSYLQIASCVVSVWSMLYFVQLLPSIGHFVIVVQHMLRDLLHFIIIFIMMLTPFVQVLYVLMNRNSTKGCVGDFNNYLASFYTTFKLMLNMVDLTQYNVNSEAAFSFLHIMYVFVVAILLINFLIALMSNSVSEVAEHKEIVMAIQRLSVAWTIELRLGWVLAPLYNRLHPRAFDCEEGRIYLVRVFFNYLDTKPATDSRNGPLPGSAFDISTEDLRKFRDTVTTKYVF